MLSIQSIHPEAYSGTTGTLGTLRIYIFALKNKPPGTTVILVISWFLNIFPSQMIPWNNSKICNIGNFNVVHSIKTSRGKQWNNRYIGNIENLYFCIKNKPPGITVILVISGFLNFSPPHKWYSGTTVSFVT